MLGVMARVALPRNAVEGFRGLVGFSNRRATINEGLR
jgi:hypothetical protein